MSNLSISFPWRNLRVSGEYVLPEPGKDNGVFALSSMHVGGERLPDWLAKHVFDHYPLPIFQCAQSFALTRIETTK